MLLFTKQAFDKLEIVIISNVIDPSVRLFNFIKPYEQLPEENAFIAYPHQRKGFWAFVAHWQKEEQKGYCSYNQRQRNVHFSKAKAEHHKHGNA